MSTESSRSRILWRAAAVGYALLILALSVVSIPKEVPSLSGIDKVLHFLAYGGLGWLVVMSYKNGRGAVAVISIAFALSFSYGALIELWQGHLGREASAADAAANGLGALAGAYVGWRWI